MGREGDLLKGNKTTVPTSLQNNTDQSLQEEIRNIVQKRNNHEHKVLSPGNSAYDWSTYARWEQSLEALRTKRCKRLKIRHLTSAHAGQGRVLGIYERAVGRHPGSGELWREYLSYTAHVKAAKRWRKTMTNALRMMPTDAELWVLAGKRSAVNGDMAAARGFFMRGCRFCTKDCKLWLEYARCEMEWLEKMERKQRLEKPKPRLPEADDELRIDDSDEDDEELENGIIMPEPTKAQEKIIDKQAAQQLASNPAMDGAIPMAIFDIAKKQGFFKPTVAESFFLLFKSFKDVSAEQRISSYVLQYLDEEFPTEPATCNCHIREPLLALSPQTAEFPRKLREVLPLIPKYMETTSDKSELQRKTAAWIDEFLAVEDLDEGIKIVLEHTKATYCTV